MKCENCGVLISSDFGFAIKNNQCPACGKNIMAQEKVGAYIELKRVLSEGLPGQDTDKIASLVVANFEIKNISKIELKNTPVQGNTTTSPEASVIKADDPDADFKANQAREAKEIIKKMRDEALNGALSDRYGMGDDSNISIDIGVEEGESIYEVAQREKLEQSRSAVLSGGGLFKRSV